MRDCCAHSSSGNLSQGRVWLNWVAFTLFLMLLIAACFGPQIARAEVDPAVLVPEIPSMLSTSGYSGQENWIRFEHISMDQGLSQSVVEAIIQDRKGFMWFATQDGLNRYDGVNFRIYKNDPDDPCSIGDNLIPYLLEDRDGVLWVGTNEGGLNRYDPETDCFTRYVNDPNDPKSLSDNSVQAIFEDQEGVLWVGTATGGLNKFDRQTGKFTRYQYDPDDANSLSNNNVFWIFEDSHGDLWVGTVDSGLNKFNRQTEEFIHFKNDPDDPGSLSDNTVQVIYEDRQGALWIGTYAGGLDKYNHQTGKFEHFNFDPDDPFSLGDNNVQIIYEDSLGELWVGTFGGGLNILDQATGKFSHFKNNPNDPTSISSNEIQVVYEDRSGVIWVGTFGSGISKFDRNKQKFALYQSNPNDANSLSDNAVWSVFEDQQHNLWVGTNSGGLNRLDRQNGKVIHYRNILTDTTSISDNSVFTIYQDYAGDLWLGTGSGLDRFDKETGQFEHYLEPTVLSVCGSQDGALWSGTVGNGLAMYDYQTGQFTYYRNDPDDPNSLSQDIIIVVYEDRGGNIWAGTYNGGLNKLDRQKEQFVRYQNQPDQPGSISYDTILAIFEDRSGVLWVGTAGGGLNKFDQQTETFTHYREKEGLDDYIYGILEDDQGFLWLSTNHGIFKFDPINEVSHQYGVEDGLQSREFNQGAFYRSDSGEMFFGGINGLNSFYPEDIKENQYIPAIVITGFQLFNAPVLIGDNSPLQKPIEETDKIELSYEQDFFSFEFASLHFSTPEKNQYAYKMEGLDKDWNYIGNRNFVSYTNVPPGDYVFRVKGTNSDGVWNETGASLEIVIVPPFWQTTWFRVLAVVTVAGGVVGVFAIRLQVIHAQKRQLEILVNERTRELQDTLAELRRSKEAAEAVNRAKSVFLANISHELRTPLNAILGFSQLALRGAEIKRSQDDGLDQDQYENLQVISRSGEHLLGLINDVLEMSKIEAGRATLNESSFDLRRMLDGLEEMFMLRAQDKGLSLDVDIAANIPPFIYLDEGKLRQVLMNLLGNAVKFTQDGGISLRAFVVETEDTEERQQTEAALRFEVEDTGPGIERDELETIFDPFTQTESGRRAQEGTGLGLSISRRFADLMGGRLVVRSQVGAGSIFTLDVPFRPVEGDSVIDITLTRRVIGMQPGQPSYRLLVVDDKEVNRALLVKLLAPIGFEVREASDGKQAIEVWQEWAPHLIWMDMRMPVMDGYEATRRIKATTRGQATVIVALTASALEEDREIILSEGCDAYIRKPFREHELFETLRHHLGVNFIYQEELKQEQVASQPLRSEDKSLQVAYDRVSTMPESLIDDLRQATLLGYQDEILKQIAIIQEIDPLLADEMAKLTKNYEHDKLLELIKKGKNEK